MGHDGHDHDHGHSHHHPHHHERSPAADEHKAHAPVSVSGFVITCSDSRDLNSDLTGRAIRESLEVNGHSVAGHRIIPDDAEAIRAMIHEASASGARAVIINGGTGIAKKDVTVECVEALFEKTLPGFGELFRMLSFDMIGSPAMMSRATAGTYKSMIVFALPGSPQAVKIAMDKLILPELGHAVRELAR
jgi:molybdenum cofactor biosynthesis protein B